MPVARIDGRDVYHEIHGEGPGPPLLLVMSMGGSCRGWLPLQIPEFSKHRTVICFDHRGVGGSSDDGSEFSTRLFADDAVALLDALEIERADVLGVFMGGMVAQEMALRHPDRLARLVLTGTYAKPDAKRRLLLEHWSDLAMTGTPIQALIRERLLWTLLDSTLESTDLIESMIEFYAREGVPFSKEVFARQCRACIEHDASDRLGEIGHQTLVICGSEDRLTPVDTNQRLANAIPKARLISIPFAAHMVLLEAAEHYNRVVLEFLTSPR